MAFYPWRAIVLPLCAVLSCATVSFANDENSSNGSVDSQAALLDQTILHDMASKQSKFRNVELSLSSCVSPLEPNMPYLSWLVAAYDEPTYDKSNVQKAMQLVIDSGCDADGLQHAGLSPLHDAIILKHSDLVSFLISNGVDQGVVVNRPSMSIDQATPIQLATILFETTGEDAYKEMIDLLTQP